MRLARAPIPILVALCAAFLIACGDDQEEPAAETTANGECAQVEPPPAKSDRFEKPDSVLQRGEPATATVTTSCGSFVIELDTERSPQTANSFAFLAKRGFYDDTVFHRIAPGFVIQGGDPKGDGSGGPGYSVREPPPQRISYTRGLVAMAKTGIEPPGTSGSQFFVVTAPADAGLMPDYAVLGEVTDGLDTVEAIGELGDPATEQPLQTIVIDTITIENG